MATKTSKRAGETTTTVSVGIRIDPKIKFALDIMGRLQKRSLTAVIEWAISNAIANQKIDTTYAVEVSLAAVLDKVWSTDESTRLVMLCFDMPQALTYDELRIWETIKVSSYFWHKYPDGSYDTTAEKIDLAAVRAGWRDLMDHVDKHKMSGVVVPIRDDEIIPF